MQSYEFLLFCHLLSVVVWVGGMAFMQWVVRPSAAELLEPSQRVTFMAATLGRFFSITALAIIVLLVSGASMMYVMVAAHQAVPRFVHVMAGLGLIMMATFGHLRFAALPRLRRAVAAQDWALGGRHLTRIRPLVTFNLVLGLVTIGVATVGRGAF